jgi:hypothetical protein
MFRRQTSVVLMSLAAAVLSVAFLVPPRVASAAPSPVPSIPHPAPSIPADVFVQSIVNRDAKLGWQQLCPAVQLQLPASQLVDQAESQRAAQTSLGLKLSAEFVETLPRPDGGELRLYRETAHWADGRTDQRTVVVRTQRDGCVEGIDPTAGRARLLAAANTADLAGDVGTALQLYSEIVSTPPSADETTAGSTAIDDLARFRTMVDLASNGRDDDARQQLAALQQRDPSGALTRIAAQFWDQYGMTGRVAAACNQLRPQAATQAGTALDTLQALGVDVDSNTLCPIPPSL